MAHRSPTTDPRGTLLFRETTEAIIGAFYQVHYEMGFGYVESVYGNCMAQALGALGIPVEREATALVHFRGKPVGRFRPDMIVDSSILVEFKATRHLDPSVDSQVLNYLRCTHLEVGLILHFGQKAAFRRLILTKDRKLLP